VHHRLVALLAPQTLEGRQDRRRRPAPRLRQVDAAGRDRGVPGVLLYAAAAGVVGHRPGHVLKQLRDTHLAVAVLVARATEALQQVVGEQAMAQFGQFNREFTLIAGGQEEPTSAGQAVQQVGAKHEVARRRRRVGGAARQDRAGVAAIQADDDGAGVQAADPARHVVHGDAAAGGVVGVGVGGQQEAFLGGANLVDEPVAGEVDQGDVGAAGAFGQPARQPLHDGVAAGILVEQHLDLAAREAAHLGVG
jgi:hypothetical protein